MEEKKWLDLLLYTDRLNRSVKEAGWNYAELKARSVKLW